MSLGCWLRCFSIDLSSDGSPERPCLSCRCYIQPCTSKQAVFVACVHRSGSTSAASSNPRRNPSQQLLLTVSRSVTNPEGMKEVEHIPIKMGVLWLLVHVCRVAPLGFICQSPKCRNTFKSVTSSCVESVQKVSLRARAQQTVVLSLHSLQSSCVAQTVRELNKLSGRKQKGASFF